MGSRWHLVKKSSSYKCDNNIKDSTQRTQMTTSKLERVNWMEETFFTSMEETEVLHFAIVSRSVSIFNLKPTLGS